MGNSLHNKIRLGRASPFTSRKLQALMVLGVIVPLSWLLLTAMR